MDINGGNNLQFESVQSRKKMKIENMCFLKFLKISQIISIKGGKKISRN